MDITGLNLFQKENPRVLEEVINFFPEKCPNWQWGPPGFLLSGYRVTCTEIKRRSVKLTTHCHLVQRSKMSEITTLYIFKA